MWRSVKPSSKPWTRPRDLFKVSYLAPFSKTPTFVRWDQADMTVLFNYRYNPCHWKIEEVISSGKIGNVKSVHFEWLLVSSPIPSSLPETGQRADKQDTVHGADYFRRWHRYKNKSGGLMVHKSSHHVCFSSLVPLPTGQRADCVVRPGQLLDQLKARVSVWDG